MAITPIQDKTITRQVLGKLAGRGLNAPCRIAVATAKGHVTLSGSVRHAYQKSAAVQLAHGIAGVKRVIDQLIVMAAARR